MRKRYFIFDTSNLAIRGFTSKRHEKLYGKNARYSGHIAYFLEELCFYLQKFRSYNKKNVLVFAIDGGHNNKCKIYPEYKENRKPVTKEDVAREFLWKDLFSDLNLLLGFLNCKIIYSYGEEADDVIASFINKHTEDQHYIYTCDKDLWQLCSKENVKIMKDYKIVDAEDLKKKFNLNEGQWSYIPLHKAIYSDAGDNIKKIPFTLRRIYFDPMLQKSKGKVKKFKKLLLSSENVSKENKIKFKDHYSKFKLMYKVAKLNNKVNVPYIVYNIELKYIVLQEYLKLYNLNYIFKDKIKLILEILR